VEVPDIGPYGLVALGLRGAPSPQPEEFVIACLADSLAVLENDVLRVEFDAAGDIVRLFDKSMRREVIPPTRRANVFQAFARRVGMPGTSALLIRTGAGPPNLLTA